MADSLCFIFSRYVDTMRQQEPMENGRTMKSGYGINESVTASVSSNQSSAITYPQNAVSYFPEFEYKTYWSGLRLGCCRRI